MQGGGGFDAGYGEVGSDGVVSKVIQTGDHFIHCRRGDAEVAGDDVVVVEGAGFRFDNELPEQFVHLFCGAELHRGEFFEEGGDGSFVLKRPHPERADCFGFRAAVGTGMGLREKGSLLFGTVKAFGALHDKTDLIHGGLCCGDAAKDTDVGSEVVVFGEAENRLHAAVIFDEFFCHCAHHHAETDFGVVLGVPGSGEVAPHTCFEVCAAEGRSVGCGDEEVALCGTGCSVEEGCRSTEGIEVDCVEAFGAHEPVGVVTGDADVAADCFCVFFDDGNGGRVAVVDDCRSAGFVCDTQPANAGRGHGVEIVLRSNAGEEEDGHVTVELHSGVVEDRRSSRRECGVFVLYRCFKCS